MLLCLQSFLFRPFPLSGPVLKLGFSTLDFGHRTLNLELCPLNLEPRTSNLELFRSAFPFAAECDPEGQGNQLQVQPKALVLNVYKIVSELVPLWDIPQCIGLDLVDEAGL